MKGRNSKQHPPPLPVLGLTYIGAPPCGLSADSIAVDSSDAPWIAGTVFNGTQPTANPIQQQIGFGLISKFSPDLTQLLFSTY
jgi:hypothetical protein